MKKKKWLVLAPLMMIGFAAFVALGGLIVQSLWNWLLPDLFGWRQVSFWQAAGLLALCRILFGGFGGHRGGGSRFRRKMAERWEAMTPEERQRFREGMWGRCGGRGAASEGERERP